MINFFQQDNCKQIISDVNKKFKKDTWVNGKIVKNFENNLQKYLKNEDRTRKLNLKINNDITKDDSSKDKQGNAQIFSMEIIFDLEVVENNIIVGKRKFNKTFEYNNQSNKFNLTQYENNLKKSLVSEISKDIVLYLYSLK